MDNTVTKRDTILDSAKLTAFLVVMAMAAMLFRFLPGIIDYVSYDVYRFLLLWTRTISVAPAEAYSTAFTNYTPFYTDLLGLVAQLPQQWWVEAIKVISIAADILLASSAGLLAKHISTVSGNYSVRYCLNIGWLTAVVVLWWPTVWLNSAYWGQCDAMWVSCCLFSLLFLMKNRPTTAMLWFGMAFSLKLQSFFMAPVVFMLMLDKRVKWWQAIYVPVVYVITCLPCAIAGRGWWSLIRVFLGQATYGGLWNYNAASFYYVLNDFQIPGCRIMKPIIMLILSIFTIWMCIKLARAYRQMPPSRLAMFLMLFAAFCGMFYPFLLPAMHERYMYLGEVGLLISACVLLTDRRVWTAAVLVEISAILVYLIALFIIRRYEFTFTLLAATLNAVAILIIARVMKKISFRG